MKICDLQTSVGRLQKETKRLREHWEQTRQHWQDKAASDFEEKYLAPLIPTLKLTLAAIHEFSEVIEEAEKQCGDQERGE
jgi:hypothetical protein